MMIKTDNVQLVNEYRSRVNRVVDFVESDISAEFSLEGLAEVAGFSKYHFNRIFHALTGESLFAFIQRVRVEKAAALLLNNQSTPIINIALDCGFSSSAAFSRCFKKHLGMSASRWRQSDDCRTDVSPAHFSSSDIMQIEPESVDVRDIPGRTLAYVRHTGIYKGDEELFVRLFEKLFQWAVPRDLAVPDETDSFVLYHDSIDITAGDLLRISGCIEVPQETLVSGEIGTLAFKGGRHVCARFRLDSTEYAEAWRWVFSSFFPSSGFQPADGLSFEFYPAQSQDGEKTLVEICVPVKPL